MTKYHVALLGASAYCLLRQLGELVALLLCRVRVAPMAHSLRVQQYELVGVSLCLRLAAKRDLHAVVAARCRMPCRRFAHKRSELAIELQAVSV